MIQLMERISHAWRDERPASASVPEQTNPCTAQNRHLPLSTAGAGRDGGTKDRETRTSKTGKHGTTERTAGKPATDAGQTGYQPINESKINWQELEDRWGVKRDNLEKSGDLTKIFSRGRMP